MIRRDYQQKDITDYTAIESTTGGVQYFRRISPIVFPPINEQEKLGENKFENDAPQK